jgi:predicted esterase
VEETADTLSALNASVNKQIYPRMGHTIIQDEIDRAMEIVRQVAD